MLSVPPRTKIPGRAPNNYILNQDISKWHFSEHGAVWTAFSLSSRCFPCLDGALERAVRNDVSSENFSTKSTRRVRISVRNHIFRCPRLGPLEFQTLTQMLTQCLWIMAATTLLKLSPPRIRAGQMGSYATWVRRIQPDFNLILLFLPCQGTPCTSENTWFQGVLNNF